MEDRSSDEKLLDALLGEDELGVVIRAHIHVEANLNKLIEILVPNPELLPRLRYEQKVAMAGALGLRKDALSPLRKIGDIRNAFGHRIDTRLTDGLAQSLFDAFSDDAKEMIRAAHERIRQHATDVAVPSFDDFNGRQLFIALAIRLTKLLESACREAREPPARGSPSGMLTRQ